MSSQSAGAEEFDYVIIGAGAAGAILANRLSEDGALSVCLLEAGPPDRHPFLHVPAGFIKVLSNPNVTWQYSAEPAEGVRRVQLTQGRTLGGSTAINGLVYNRGQREDFEQWAALGNRGWSYAEVLPYFKRNERHIGATDTLYRGRVGLLPVTDCDWKHPVCERFIAGAEGLGLPRNPDYNGLNQAGVGYFQRTIAGRWRMSTARTYLKPARRQSNLSIRTNARAIAINFEGKRAVGVQYVPEVKGAPTAHREMKARREVLLCAGALSTPKLLQLSGLGPGTLLHKLGIPVVSDLPGIGQNLNDHFAVRVVAGVKGEITINELSRPPRLWGEITKWLLGRPGILTLSPSVVHWFWHSQSGLSRPDLQGVFSPASYRQGCVGLLDKFPGMTAGVWAHRPYSRGTVQARSPDPFSDPIIHANYLSDERDRATLIAGLRLARRLLQTPELADIFLGESLPGSQVQSDDELLDYAKRYGASSYHVSGTARMGPENDPAAVLDDQLRVRGVEGLRVVDASVMPSVTSANTCAATMMIAEKAADMIRGRPPLAPVSLIDARPVAMATMNSNS